MGLVMRKHGVEAYILLVTNKVYGVHLLKLISSNTLYGKCSKNSNTFLFLSANKMLVIRAESPKMLTVITNREDPDQTASSEAV